MSANAGVVSFLLGAPLALVFVFGVAAVVSEFIAGSNNWWDQLVALSVSLFFLGLARLISGPMSKAALAAAWTACVLGIVFFDTTWAAGLLLIPLAALFVWELPSSVRGTGWAILALATLVVSQTFNQNSGLYLFGALGGAAFLWSSRERLARPNRVAIIVLGGVALGAVCVAVFDLAEGRDVRSWLEMGLALCLTALLAIAWNSRPGRRQPPATTET